jgi:exodeoxyribonuclease-5
VRLSKDQHNAAKKIVGWYFSPKRTRFVTLGGYAGTGKTTLIGVIKSEISRIHAERQKNAEPPEVQGPLNTRWSGLSKKSRTPGKHLKMALCSYTGRATQNLKTRLQENDAISWRDTISTIHGLIYDPIENSSGVIVGWRQKDEIEADLIIVDEASMIDQQIWRDLLSYNVPIIAVGDHGQLPPIRGKFSLMQKPMLKLEKIHRQATGNPIVKVATLARRNGVVPHREFGNNIVKFDRKDPFTSDTVEELLQGYTEDTIILCGYNSTRNQINNYVRAALGFESPEPQPGDRVICQRNNHKKQIYNGMLGTIERINKADEDWFDVEILMDDSGVRYVGLVYAHQFGAPVGINFTENRALALKGDLFDFGYALTVHKAQGSQARKVIMFEERFKQMDDDMWKRWLYTGITRAQEELFLVG